MTHLRSHRRNTIRLQHIVITVSVHLLAHDLARVAKLDTLGELGVYGDVIEDSEVAGSPLIDVVGCLTVEGPDEIVPGCVAVYDELEFLFVVSHELVESLVLWLREWLGTGPILAADLLGVL